MDVINAYLETMFSPYPQSPRLLDAKQELRGMMEDAYNEAIAAGLSNNEAVGKVITEFGNLDELAPVLGIASDIRSTTAQPPFPDAGAASATAGFSPAAGTFSSSDPGGSGFYSSSPESTHDEEIENSFPRPIRVARAILWPLTMVIYLIWSFGWSAWDISWIVWPISGALTGLIFAVGRAWGNERY